MAVKLERPGADQEQSRDEAFAELYEGTYHSLVGYCRGLLGKGGDAEGVAQEAFLRAWMSWDRYSSRPFWALVATIARNLCMDHHRHERVVVSVLEHRAGELSTPDDPAPEEQVELDEEYRWAREALSQLQPNHQRLLDLREVNGWSCEAIAEAEGTNADSVAAALYRARQRLREAYAKLAAGALGAVGLLPLRPLRRRLGLWAHYGGEAASASPAITTRAGEAIAAAVALAVVSTGAPAPAAPPPVRAGRPAVVAAHFPASSKAAVADKPAPAATPGDHSGAHANGDATPVVPATLPAEMALSPEQATFSQFAAPGGPAGASNELYATGVSLEGCVSSCPVLFHSGDAGATWQRLAAVGFAGGTLLLPPGYPTDNRIFAAGPTALQVSTDGGATFTTLAPVGGAAAMSPAFAAGDPRILLGSVPGWEFHDDLKTVTPLQLGPLPSSQGLTFAFSPTYPNDQRVLVGGATTDDSNKLHSSVVSVCHASACDDPVSLAGSDGVPSLLVSRSFATSGLAFAWAGPNFYRSTDGGARFRPIPAPAPAGVQALAEGANGTLYAALLGTDADGHPVGGLFLSHDEGRVWVRLADDTALGKGAATVAALADGHLVAAPASGGFMCSADGGKTWAVRCPVPPRPAPAAGAAPADSSTPPADPGATPSAAVGQPAAGS